MMTGARELYKKPPPLSEALADLSTREVVNIVIFKTRSPMDITKGPEFNDLLDFAIAENGKIIYLLNDSCVYKIKSE